jgi:large subunit ribosomal protein L30
MTKTNIAVIRIRGTDDVNGEIEATMKMLKLMKKHTCSVYPKSDSLMGMLSRCKDYITYGELDEETHKLLLEKRPVKKLNKKTNKEEVQNYFHLQPPRGGFERKGIKTPFSMKGALGYRKEKINALIKKMI